MGTVREWNTWLQWSKVSWRTNLYRRMTMKMNRIRICSYRSRRESWKTWRRKDKHTLLAWRTFQKVTESFIWYLRLNRRVKYRPRVRVPVGSVGLARVMCLRKSVVADIIAAQVQAPMKRAKVKLAFISHPSTKAKTTKWTIVRVLQWWSVHLSRIGNRP